MAPRRRVRCWPIVGHFQFGERIGITGLSGLGRNRFLAPSSGMYSSRRNNLEGSAQFFARLAKAVFGNRPGESADELLLQIRQLDSGRQDELGSILAIPHPRHLIIGRHSQGPESSSFRCCFEIDSNCVSAAANSRGAQGYAVGR